MNMNGGLKISLKRMMPELLYPTYIKYQYFKHFGKICNLNNPQTFSEKIQWGKLHRDNAVITELADKIEVRKYVADRIGQDYLIPMVGGPYSKAEEIDFDSLPNSFVIKANHGSGLNLVVADKSQIDIDLARKKINGWLEKDYAFFSLELQYKDISPRIYIEQNLMSDGMNDLSDYKFYCFGGKVFCLNVTADTYPVRSKAKLSIYDRDFNLMPYKRTDHQLIDRPMKKPKNYDKMIEVAELLAEGFSHVRVDLYNVEGKIYFGELTFTSASGFCKFDPDEFDIILGEKWDLKAGI